MITYTVGDATDPPRGKPVLLVHVCNDSGRWGKGFVVALSRRWKEPERAFRAAGSLALGEVQVVQVEPLLWVVNMVGQHGVARRGSSHVPVRYEAIRECLGKVASEAGQRGAEVHMPRIGAGLAGGDWSVIEGLIEATLVHAGIPVVVYDLP